MLQEALADSQLQAVKSQLERRGLSINTDEAQAVQLAGGQQVLIPFGEDVHLVWTRTTNGQTAAVGLVRQGTKTLNISGDGQERVMRFLPEGKVQRLLSGLRQKSKFQELERKLAQKGKRVGKIRVLFDETTKIAILGIAIEGDEEKIVHQVRIKLKAGKDDEPDNEEPQIQATACGQAIGEAVPAGVKLQPLTAPPGEGGDIGGGYEGPQICTSQWGYDYHCTSRFPMLSLSATSLTLPQTFINQQTQGSFVVWNSGGGRLTGTVSVPAPFSVVSGASFNLLPGQPQEVVVRFSSANPGSFSRNVSISSNGGNATVTATSIAHKISFSPAQVDFGSGLLVLREQCNQMGTCGLGTEKVGLPIERTLTVKNEGTVAVTLTLSTSAPYRVVSALPTLAPGQSGQVTLRFDPNESGTFTGAVQVGLNGGQGSVTASLTGVAHKIEISKKRLDFGIAFVNSTEYQRLTIKNQGLTTVSLAVSATEPFTIVSENSFTLIPGQSSEVVVNIHPTVTGSISGTIYLTSSSVSFEITARARAMTYEEYAEAMLGAFNSLTSLGYLGYYGMIYAWDTRNTPREVLLAGFQNLDQPQVEHWMAMAQSWESFPNPEQQEMDPRLQEVMNLLNSIDHSTLGRWLQELADAIANNRFYEVYNTLLPQGLDRLERALLLILDSQDPQDVRNFLSDWLTTLQPLLEQPPQLLPSLEQIARIWALSIRIVIYMVPTYPPWEAEQKASEFGKSFFNNWYKAFITIATYIGRRAADQFTDALEAIAKHIMDNYKAFIIPYFCGPGCQLITGLSGLAQYGSFGSRQAKLTYGSVNILHNVIRAGNPNDPFDRPWTLIGIVGADGEPFDPSRHGNFFLVERITGIEGRSNITVVARGDHCSVCINYSDIINWIEEAIRVLEQHRARRDRGIVIYVFTDPFAIGTDQALQAIEEYVASLRDNRPIAILVVRVMPNGTVQYKCVGKGCGMYTPEELKKMACKQATGRAVCRAEPWPRQSQLPSNPDNQEQPDSGIIEEPDWDETEPVDPNSLPEPRCPVCN